MIRRFLRPEIANLDDDDPIISRLRFRHFHDGKSAIYTIQWIYGFDMIMRFSRQEISNSNDDSSAILRLWFCYFYDKKSYDLYDDDLVIPTTLILCELYDEDPMMSTAMILQHTDAILWFSRR